MSDEVETTPGAAIQPEGAMRFRPFTEDAPDAEGHAAKFRGFTDDAPGPDDYKRHATDDPGTDEAPGPDGFKRHATDDPDTEGHMPLRKVSPAPATDEPGEEDTEAHVIKAADDAGMEPEAGKRIPPFSEGDDDTTGIKGDGAVKRN